MPPPWSRISRAIQPAAPLRFSATIRHSEGRGSNLSRPCRTPFAWPPRNVSPRCPGRWILSTGRDRSRAIKRESRQPPGRRPTEHDRSRRRRRSSPARQQQRVKPCPSGGRPRFIHQAALTPATPPRRHGIHQDRTRISRRAAGTIQPRRHPLASISPSQPQPGRIAIERALEFCLNGDSP